MLHKISKKHVVDVLDPIVLCADSKQVILQVLKIAALCLSDRPVNRPTMLEVLKFLKRIDVE